MFTALCFGLTPDKISQQRIASQNSQVCWPIKPNRHLLAFRRETRLHCRRQRSCLRENCRRKRVLRMSPPGDIIALYSISVCRIFLQLDPTFSLILPYYSYSLSSFSIRCSPFIGRGWSGEYRVEEPCWGELRYILRLVASYRIIVMFPRHEGSVSKGERVNEWERGRIRREQYKRQKRASNTPSVVFAGVGTCTCTMKPLARAR